MVPLMKGKTASSKSAIFARYLYMDTVRYQDKQYTSFCRLDRCWDANSCRNACKEDSDADMLYDRSIDPEEDVNRAKDPAYSMVVQEMRATLQRHAAGQKGRQVK